MTDPARQWERSGGAFQPGTLVGSRYRLVSVAGAGGMATVWRAHDQRLQRPVAIKVISDSLVSDPAALARFSREARTHAGIQHPNLVQLYDYSVTGPRPYLVMEFVNGHTLSERLDGGGLPPDAIQTLAAELLSAVACVHDHGVLHRDIKSGNVLIDQAGHARLTDFGLARFEGSTQITRSNEVVGTLRFLAPELIDGQPASRQSDLYALGVLLRTVAAGTEVSAPLPRLITWLTQHDPRARPSDAHAVLAAIDAEGQERTRRPSASPPETTGPTSRDPAAGQQPRAPANPGVRRYTASRPLSRTTAMFALVLVVAVTSLALLGAAGGAARAHAKASRDAAIKGHN